MTEQMTRPPADTAPLREQARAAARATADEWKRQAADAGRDVAGRARAALVRQLRHVSAETRKHRPSAAAAVLLTVTGLWFAHGHRVAAVLSGPVVGTAGAVVVYAVAYWVQYGRARRAGDTEWFTGRRVGRNARRNARQVAAGAVAFGGWLTGLGILGVGAASTYAAGGLAVELSAVALLAWLVCRQHWAKLWEDRRRLRELADQRRATPGDDVLPSGADVEADAPPEPPVSVVRDERLPAPPPLVAPARSGSPLGVGEWTETIQRVLVQRGIDATVSGYIRGPVVTRYDVVVAGSVSVRKVEALAPDFSVALDGRLVRVICPVPGRPVVGVEVPNAVRETVPLAEVLRSAVMVNDPRPLLVCVGKSVDGQFVTADLTEMPHLLIGAATGGGKSVLIKSMLATILSRATPDQVRLLLVDPKRVELALFAGVPHLVRPIVKDAAKAVDAVEWLVSEMECRYQLLEDAGVVDVGEYNALPDVTPLPFLLGVIDELADLMMVAAGRRKADEDEPELEDLLIRLLQLARAAGIHLLLATQDPRVEVITGRIKANLPSRIALATASGTDSKVILDKPGAELLTGKGDALFRPMGTSAAVRVQAPLVTRDEIKAVVEHWLGQADDWAPYRGAELEGSTARPRQVPVSAVSAPDVVLAIAVSQPGCSSAAIVAHPVWGLAKLGAPSQSQLSRVTGALVDAGLLSRVKDGRSWSDYRVTDAGRSRAERAATALHLMVSDDAALSGARGER